MNAKIKKASEIKDKNLRRLTLLNLAFKSFPRSKQQKKIQQLLKN